MAKQTKEKTGISLLPEFAREFFLMLTTVFRTGRKTAEHIEVLQDKTAEVIGIVLAQKQEALISDFKAPGADPTPT